MRGVGAGIAGLVIYIVNPTPGLEVRLALVKEASHPMLDFRCYIVKLSMLNPVLSRIRGQREVLNPVLYNVVIKLKKYAQACSGKKSMRGSQ
jgi:hypothetical protein